MKKFWRSCGLQIRKEIGRTFLNGGLQIRRNA